MHVVRVSKSKVRSLATIENGAIYIAPFGKIKRIGEKRRGKRWKVLVAITSR